MAITVLFQRLASRYLQMRAAIRYHDLEKKKSEKEQEKKKE